MPYSPTNLLFSNGKCNNKSFKASLVFIFLQMIYCKGLDEEFCKESKYTVIEVSSCPIDQTEWNIKATEKSCSSRVHNCSRNLTYHCLINPWQNNTIEVCAPKTKISAGYCAEYNTRGGKVQELHTKSCSTCNYTYESTDAYKYQECYNVVYSRHVGNVSNRTIEDKIKNTESITHIAIIISAVMSSCLVCSCVFLVKYRRYCRKALRDLMDLSLTSLLCKKQDDMHGDTGYDEDNLNGENEMSTFSDFQKSSREGELYKEKITEVEIQ